MQYVGQILMGVLMASFMTIMIPRAAVSAERIGEVLASESTLTRAANPVSDFAAPRRGRASTTWSSPTPAPSRRSCRASASGARGRDGRDRRLDRLGQDDARVPHPAPVRRDRRRRARGRRRRPRGGSRLAVEGHRPGAAAAVPLLRHRRVEPAVRPRGGDRRRPLEGARDRAGQGLRRGDGGPAERAHRAGRHQRLRRAASATRDRPRDHPPAGHPRLRRLVLRARPDHRCAIAAGAVARAAGRHEDRRRAARLDHHGSRPDRGARGRADGRRRHA